MSDPGGFTSKNHLSCVPILKAIGAVNKNGLDCETHSSGHLPSKVPDPSMLNLLGVENRGFSYYCKVVNCKVGGGGGYFY